MDSVKGLASVHNPTGGKSSASASAQQSKRLVLAIDYGHVSTGVAYAVTSSHYATLADTRLVNYWGPRQGQHDKIPSVISYSPASDGEEQWGASLSPEAVRINSVKAELGKITTMTDELLLTLQLLEDVGNLSFDHIEKGKGCPEHALRDPERVLTDYLTRIFSFVNSDVLSHLNAEEFRSVDLVLTVPTHWSYGAKNSLFRAARQACIDGSPLCPRPDIILLDELEAALHATHRHMTEMKTLILQPRDCFIVCDAGGHTIKAATYQITSLAPSLTVQQLPRTSANSVTCGATCIKFFFQRWLEEIIGKENYQLLAGGATYTNDDSYTSTETTAMGQLMQQLDKLLMAFPKNELDERIALPAPLDGLNVPGRVFDGQLQIKPALLELLFDYSIKETESLVLGQLDRLETRKSLVRGVFLVGGLARSRHFREQIGNRLRRVPTLRPHYIDTRHSATAAVRGAVIYGVEKDYHGKTNRALPCLKSFGIGFDSFREPPKPTYKQPNLAQPIGAAVMHQRISWLIRKGDLVSADGRTTIERHYMKTKVVLSLVDFVVSIYESEDNTDEPGSQHSTPDVVRIGVIKVDSRQTPNGSTWPSFSDLDTDIQYSVLDLVCRMHFAADSLKVEVLTDGVTTSSSFSVGGFSLVDRSPTITREMAA